MNQNMYSSYFYMLVYRNLKHINESIISYDGEPAREKTTNITKQKKYEEWKNKKKSAVAKTSRSRRFVHLREETLHPAVPVLVLVVLLVFHPRGRWCDGTEEGSHPVATTICSSLGRCFFYFHAEIGFYEQMWTSKGVRWKLIL